MVPLILNRIAGFFISYLLGIKKMISIFDPQCKIEMYIHGGGLTYDFRELSNLVVKL